jgi:hypothetical protein
VRTDEIALSKPFNVTTYAAAQAKAGRLMFLLLISAAMSHLPPMDEEYRDSFRARSQCMSAFVRAAKQHRVSFSQFETRFDRTCLKEAKRHRELTKRRLMEERQMTAEQASRYIAEREAKVRRVLLDGYRRNPNPRDDFRGYAPPPLRMPPPPVRK